jgi:hypothetical protein
MYGVEPLVAERVLTDGNCERPFVGLENHGCPIPVPSDYFVTRWGKEEYSHGFLLSHILPASMVFRNCKP